MIGNAALADGGRLDGVFVDGATASFCGAAGVWALFDDGVTVRARAVGGAVVDGGVFDGLGGRVAAGKIVLGMRTDFRHRLQSNDLMVEPTGTTSGAEQCGQSKRISLLAVPVCDAPPFCIVRERKQ